MNMATPLPPGASINISDAAQTTPVRVDNELDIQVLRKQIRRPQFLHLAAGKTSRKRLIDSSQTGHRVLDFLTDALLPEELGAL